VTIYIDLYVWSVKVRQTQVPGGFRFAQSRMSKEEAFCSICSICSVGSHSTFLSWVRTRSGLLPINLIFALVSPPYARVWMGCWLASGQKVHGSIASKL